MKEQYRICRLCRHVFHAKAPCPDYDRKQGRPCECEGYWYEEAPQVSGFCFNLVGTAPATERAAHAACPGRDYPYPCECSCHRR